MNSRTIIEKVWDSHVVHAEKGAPTLLFIDLHLVHEVTSPQAFSGYESPDPSQAPPITSSANISATGQPGKVKPLE